MNLFPTITGEHWKQAFHRSRNEENPIAKKIHQRLKPEPERNMKFKVTVPFTTTGHRVYEVESLKASRQPECWEKSNLVSQNDVTNHDWKNADLEPIETAESWQVAEAMRKYGGGFVKCLADMIARADSENLERIQETWPEYWKQYSDMALKDRKNSDET